MDTADAANDVRSGLSVYLCLLDIASATEHVMDPESFTHSVAPTLVQEEGIVSKLTSSPGALPTTSSPDVAALPRRVDEAYQLWYNDGLEIDDICARMRSKEHPLRRTTVAYGTVLLPHIEHVLTQYLGRMC